MTALATRTGAINLGQGFPDEDGPAEVLDAARDAIAQGGNQYPPGRGIPDLRHAITEHQQRFYGLTLDPERDVLVTAGATEAIAAALLAFVDSPDDEIVVRCAVAVAACVTASSARASVARAVPSVLFNFARVSPSLCRSSEFSALSHRPTSTWRPSRSPTTCSS